MTKKERQDGQVNMLFGLTQDSIPKRKKGRGKKIIKGAKYKVFPVRLDREKSGKKIVKKTILLWKMKKKKKKYNKHHRMIY